MAGSGYPLCAHRRWPDGPGRGRAARLRCGWAAPARLRPRRSRGELPRI